MRVIDVPENTRVFLGTPATPWEEPLVGSIAAELYAIEGVEELHLPQCFALGVMKSPATVLVIVLGATTSTVRVTRQVKRQLKRVLPPERHLDLWLLAFASPFASAVRQVNCLIERDPMSLPVFRKPKPWWRVLNVG